MSIDALRAAVSDLQTAAQDEHNELDAVVTQLSTVEGQLTQLQTQVAQGGGVTQADIDAVASSVSGIAAAARSAVESAKASTGGGTPPPAPAPTPTPITAPTTDPGTTTDPAGGTPTPDPVAPTDPVAPPTPAPAPAPAPTPDTGGGAAQRTLYAFGGDPSTVDQSVWPPAGVQTDEPSPRPLFTYSGDQNPGDTNGEGVGGLWTAYTGTTQPAASGSGGEA